MTRAQPAVFALATLFLAASAGAQQNGSRLDFSGVIFANYQWRTDSAARQATGGQAPNKFDLQRVYLNFRMPAGEKASIRVTTDLFQQLNTLANTFYSGWAVRLKYAYLQYDFTNALAGVQGLGATGRLGLLHTVMVDHIDSFWLRWLGVNALETHGYFASADAGAATLVTLPNRWGESYFTIVNGTGYTAAENDRFKDYAARFSFTPFGRDSGFLRTLAITPWYSVGATASQFAAGGTGQVGPVADGLQRDRRGVFMGLRDRRLTGGLHFSQRIEDVESGANTPASPRAVRRRTSQLIDGFALVRPFEIANPERRSNLGIVGRLDHFELDRDVDASRRFLVLGLVYDINSRLSTALDYQQLRPESGSAAPRTETWFAHFVVNF
jgi:hypothetical protein